MVSNFRLVSTGLQWPLQWSLVVLQVTSGPIGLYRSLLWSFQWSLVIASGLTSLRRYQVVSSDRQWSYKSPQVSSGLWLSPVVLQVSTGLKWSLVISSGPTSLRRSQVVSGDLQYIICLYTQHKQGVCNVWRTSWYGYPHSVIVTSEVSHTNGATV